MELTLAVHQVNAMRFGPSTGFDNGTLAVDANRLIEDIEVLLSEMGDVE